MFIKCLQIKCTFCLDETLPKRSEATDEQARNRQMPDITWEAQLEGAVHGVKVKGTLRATLSA